MVTIAFYWVNFTNKNRYNHRSGRFLVPFLGRRWAARLPLSRFIDKKERSSLSSPPALTRSPSPTPPLFSAREKHRRIWRSRPLCRVSSGEPLPRCRSDGGWGCFSPGSDLGLSPPARDLALPLSTSGVSTSSTTPGSTKYLITHEILLSDPSTACLGFLGVSSCLMFD